MSLNSKKNSTKNTVNNIDDMIVDSISSIMKKQPEDIWTGTMTELSVTLNKFLSKSQRSVAPKSPSALRVVLNRVTNRIRNSGIGVKFGRTSSTRFVRFAQ